jgi:Zn ribbon nucleic-acid-binding protein
MVLCGRAVRGAQLSSYRALHHHHRTTAGGTALRACAVRRSQSLRDNQRRLKFSPLIAHIPDNLEIIMATMDNTDSETAQPTCQNCTTSTTPLWRRDEIGSVLCNACGLFLKLHGRPRPISLKTDVIKSRNRVKSSGAAQGAKKKASRIVM